MIWDLHLTCLGNFPLTADEIANLEEKMTISVNNSEGNTFLFKHEGGQIFINEYAVMLEQWTKAQNGDKVELAGGQTLDGAGATTADDFLKNVKLGEKLIFGTHPTIHKFGQIKLEEVNHL